MNVKKTLYGTAAALCTLGAISAVNMDEVKERQGIASEPADTGKAVIYLCGALGAGIMAMRKRDDGKSIQAGELSQGDMKDAVAYGAGNLQKNCADFMKEAKNMAEGKETPNMALESKENGQPENKKEIPFEIYCGKTKLYSY